MESHGQPTALTNLAGVVILVSMLVEGHAMGDQPAGRETYESTGDRARDRQQARSRRASKPEKKGFLERWADFSERSLANSRRHFAELRAMSDAATKEAVPEPAATSAPLTAPRGVTPTGTAAAPSVACPACGSGNCATLAMVHAQGSSTTNTIGTAAGMAFGGGQATPVVAVTHSVGVSQTALAQQAAPPLPRRVFGAFDWLVSGAYRSVGASLVALVVIAFISGEHGQQDPSRAWLVDLTFVLVWCAGTILLVILKVREQADARRFNQKQFPRMQATWRASWMCLSCGERFSPRRPTAADPANQAG